MRPTHLINAALNTRDALSASQPSEIPPAPAQSLPPEAQAVYLVLAVTLLLFLLLFVVIALNVARRLARRRDTLRRLHQPARAIPPESAWAAAGKRARPITEPLDSHDTDPDSDDDEWDDDSAEDWKGKGG